MKDAGETMMISFGPPTFRCERSSRCRMQSLQATQSLAVEMGSHVRSRNVLSLIPLVDVLEEVLAAAVRNVAVRVSSGHFGSA